MWFCEYAIIDKKKKENKLIVLLQQFDKLQQVNMSYFEITLQLSRLISFINSKVKIIFFQSCVSWLTLYIQYASMPLQWFNAM